MGVNSDNDFFHWILNKPEKTCDLCAHFLFYVNRNESSYSFQKIEVRLEVGCVFLTRPVVLK